MDKENYKKMKTNYLKKEEKFQNQANEIMADYTKCSSDFTKFNQKYELEKILYEERKQKLKQDQAIFLEYEQQFFMLEREVKEKKENLGRLEELLYKKDQQLKEWKEKNAKAKQQIAKWLQMEWEKSIQTNRYYFCEDICEGKKPFLKSTLQSSNIFDQNIFESQPFMKEEILIQNSPDLREKVSKTDHYPFSSIGLIFGEINYKQCFGTGTLIGPDIVITCAHNCYSKKFEQQIKYLKFSPAANGSLGKIYSVKKIYYSQQFIHKKGNESFQFDFAILVLEASLEKEYGFLGVDFSAKNIKETQEIEVSGYPADKIENEKKTMWTAKGKYTKMTDEFLYHQIPTYQGQSGGPVFKKQGKNYYLVGIHIMGNQKTSENLCRRLNSKMIQKINSWIGWQRQELKLNNRKITDQEIQLMFAGDLSKKLTSIDISINKLTEKGLQIFDQPKWNNLLTLDISLNKIGDLGIERIKKVTWLKELQVSNCGISERGVQIISKNHTSLQILKIGENLIGNKGIEHLSSLRELRKVFLMRTKITEEGVKMLVKMKLQNLGEVVVSKEEINESVVDNMLKEKQIQITYF